MIEGPSFEQRMDECMRHQRRDAQLLCEGPCQHSPLRPPLGHYTPHVKVALNRYVCAYCGTERVYGASDPTVSQASFYSGLAVARELDSRDGREEV